MNTPRPPEDEVHYNDARLRTLATTTSVVVWYTAADGAVVARNPSWEAFTGQSFEQSLGWGWVDAIHPDDRQDVLDIWQRGVGSKVLVELKYRLHRHDGQYRDVAAQGAPVIEDGVVREWVGFCVDVTASKQAEEVLKASEERFRFLDRLGQATRTLTDATRVMEVTARLLGEYLHVTRCAYADVEADSNRFTIRSDWSVEGVSSSAGVYSLDLFGPRATYNLRRGKHLVVNDVDSELGEEGGGRMFNAIGIKAVICTALVKDDRLVALMAVHQSTPREWTEAEIAVIEEVVERCWAHIERVRDNAMLREQDRRKDEFLATLAHELRNPLAPIKYAVAMMRKSTNGDYTERAHEVIDRQVSLMARLIDDLLDLSRINRGMIQLKPDRVRLGDLMQQAALTARPAMEAAHHRLDVLMYDEDLWLDADPTRMVQVIGNLLTNAAKYTPDGGHIRLAARRAGGMGVLEVIDNGIGIPPDEQGQLFQMFTQLRHSADRAQGGLGIGLALVKTLVHMHQGSVRVFSQGLNQGSTFTVELPLAEPKSMFTPVPVIAAEATPAQDNHAMRVLVVEDNKDGLTTLVTLLDAMGYQVAGADDGLQGLEVARSFRPHVVLLDLGLPGMDGFGVARALRADPQFKHVFIVALTGWGAERDRQRTTEAGFDAHLTKPVEPDVLEAYLSRFSKQRRQS